MRRKVSVGLVATALTSALAATPAPAVSTAVAAAPGAWLTTFATPAVVAEVGGALTFYNGDISEHDVVADAFLPEPADPASEPWCFKADGSGERKYPVGTCPLFWTIKIPFGSETTVLGLDNVSSGSVYGFHCEPHPWMTGTLVAI